MEHTKHIWRMSLLLVFLFTAGIFARHFMVPESFGEAGFYRYDAMTELTAKSPRHGAVNACADCHEDKVTALAAGLHSAVQCEVCHDVLSTHVQDDDKYRDMAINRSYRLCAYCHQKLLARPVEVAQIVLAEHLELDSSQAIAEEACLECHDSEEIHRP